MTTPQSRLDLSALPNPCQASGKLRIMTGLFRQWLILHFSDPQAIIDVNKKDVWVWRPDPLRAGEADPKTSKILIEPVGKYAKEFTDARPAVLIKRHKWTSHKVGINNQLLGAVGPGGVSYFATYFIGAHTLFCISREPAEAELLANEVYEEINQFSRAVRQRLNLFRLEVAEVGEAGILKESGQSFAVPVVVAYAVEDTWEMRREAPFFNRFDAALMGL